MYDCVIKLISESKTIDEYGDFNVTETERVVFAEMRSIGQSEFYQAEAVGLKPEIKFILPDFLEYQNEKLIKFTPYGGEEEEYTVLRTYRANNTLELVCKRGIE